MKKKLFPALLALAVVCTVVLTACGNQAEEAAFGKATEALSSEDITDTSATEVSLQAELTVPANAEPAEPEITLPELPNPAVYKLDNTVVIVGFTLQYDENRNVTQVTYTMETAPDTEITSQIKKYFERFEGYFNQLRNNGGNASCKYTDSDGSCVLSATVELTGTTEVDFICEFLGGDSTGEYLALTDADKALRGQGFTIFTE